MDKHLGPKRKVPETGTSKQGPKNKKQQVRPIHHYFAKEKEINDSNTDSDGNKRNEPKPAESESEKGGDHSERSAHDVSSDKAECSQADKLSVKKVIVSHSTDCLY